MNPTATADLDIDERMLVISPPSAPFPGFSTPFLRGVILNRQSSTAVASIASSPSISRTSSTTSTASSTSTFTRSPSSNNLPLLPSSIANSTLTKSPSNITSRSRSGSISGTIPTEGRSIDDLLHNTVNRADRQELQLNRVEAQMGEIQTQLQNVVALLSSKVAPHGHGDHHINRDGVCGSDGVPPRVGDRHGGSGDNENNSIGINLDIVDESPNLAPAALDAYDHEVLLPPSTGILDPSFDKDTPYLVRFKFIRGPGTGLKEKKNNAKKGKENSKISSSSAPAFEFHDDNVMGSAYDYCCPTTNPLFVRYQNKTSSNGLKNISQADRIHPYNEAYQKKAYSQELSRIPYHGKQTLDQIVTQDFPSHSSSTTTTLRSIHSAKERKKSEPKMFDGRVLRQLGDRKVHAEEKRTAMGMAIRAVADKSFYRMEDKEYRHRLRFIPGLSFRDVCDPEFLGDHIKLKLSPTSLHRYLKTFIKEARQKYPSAIDPVIPTEEYKKTIIQAVKPPGRPNKMPAHLEYELLKWIYSFTSRRYILDPHSVRAKAARLMEVELDNFTRGHGENYTISDLVQSNYKLIEQKTFIRRSDERSGGHTLTPSRQWLHRLMKRNPFLRYRVASPANKSAKPSIEKITQRMHEYGELAIRYPRRWCGDRILGFDESALSRLCGSRKGIGILGQRATHQIGCRDFTHVTIAPITSASGKCLAVLWIQRISSGGTLTNECSCCGKEHTRVNPTMDLNNLPLGSKLRQRSLIAANKSGFMTSCIFKELMEKISLFAREDLADPTDEDDDDAGYILIVDNHSSRLTPMVQERCGEMNVELSFLVAGSTGESQPHDKGLFGPMKQAIRGAIDEWASDRILLDPGLPPPVTQDNLFRIIGPRLDEFLFGANSASLIQKSFAATGHWPFRPYAIEQQWKADNDHMNSYLAKKAAALGKHFSPDEIEKRSQASTSTASMDKRINRSTARQTNKNSRTKSNEIVEIKTLQTATEQQEQRELQEEKKYNEEIQRIGEAHAKRIQKEIDRASSALLKLFNQDDEPKRKRRKSNSDHGVEEKRTKKKQRMPNTSTGTYAPAVDRQEITMESAAMGSYQHQICESKSIQAEFIELDKEEKQQKYTKQDGQRACDELKQNLKNRPEKNVSLLSLDATSLFNQLTEYIIQPDYPWSLSINIARSTSSSSSSSTSQDNIPMEAYYKAYPRPHDRRLSQLFLTPWKESVHGADNTLTHYSDTQVSFASHATNLWRKMTLRERLVALLMYLHDRDKHVIAVLLNLLEEEEKEYIRKNINRLRQTTEERMHDRKYGNLYLWWHTWDPQPPQSCVSYYKTKLNPNIHLLS